MRQKIAHHSGSNTWKLGGPLAAVLVVSAVPAASAGGSPLGVWMDHTGRGAVEITRCGSALCGHVVWVKSATDAKGCGRQIIGDARPTSNGAHDGWIYSPEDKKRFNVEITPLSNGRLRVVGYKGIRLFSRTMTWTRAAAGLERCGETAAKAKAVEKIAAVTPVAAPPAAAPASTPDAVKADVISGKSAKAESAAPAPTATPPQPSAPAQRKAAVDAVRPAPTPELPAAEKSPQAGPKAAAPTATTEENADTTADPATPSEPSQEANEEDGGADDHDGGGLAGLDLKSLDLKSLEIEKLDLGKVIKRTANGRCKLDLPFVKVKFDCNR